MALPAKIIDFEQLRQRELAWILYNEGSHVAPFNSGW